MQIRLTAHLSTPEAREKFSQHIRASEDVLNRFRQLLDESLKESEKTNINDYEKASWAYLAADRSGYQRALKEVISLLTTK